MCPCVGNTLHVITPCLRNTVYMTLCAYVHVTLHAVMDLGCIIFGTIALSYLCPAPDTMGSLRSTLISIPRVILDACVCVDGVTIYIPVTVYLTLLGCVCGWHHVGDTIRMYVHDTVQD